MRTYAVSDERAVQTERHVKEWTRSGLLDQSQQDRMLLELKLNFRRTNVFLRLVLFIFGLLIIAAMVALVIVTSKVHDDATVAVICIFSSVASFIVAETLASRLRFYRFGIEEAAAVASVFLLSLGVMLLTSSFHPTDPEFPPFVALIAGGVGALFVYRRFGYIYAAAGSMLCVSAAPFMTRYSETTQRLIAAGILMVVFLIVRLAKRKHRDDYLEEEYSMIQAIAWLGAYLYLNLHLKSLELAFGRIHLVNKVDYAQTFYWGTYALIWLLPAFGLYLALRQRDRPLLDINLVLSLVTLATNKPYWNAPRQPWDPILLGILLIGTTLILRRRLTRADTSGFTSERILFSDKRTISTVGTLSAALHTIPHSTVDSASPRTYEPGGGRSGGGGADGRW